MNQQDFDSALKTLPDAGSYPNDIYIVPMIGYRMIFRKKSFQVFPLGVFVQWNLDSIDIIKQPL